MARTGATTMGRAWLSKIYGQLVHGKGLLASLVAAVGFTVSPVLSRRAADVGVPGFQLVLVNELCKFAMFVPLALVFRAPLRGKDWKQTVLMIANGGLRALGGTLLVLSVILIPPGNVLAISQGAAAPMFGMMAAWLVMREAPGWPNVIGIVFQLTGVAMIVFGGKPVLDSSTVLGYVLQYFVIHITPHVFELCGASIVVMTIVVVVGFTWKQRARDGAKEFKEESSAPAMCQAG
ncbi:hypothetical protein Bbelb_275120 [Branchiostoma belcheri]|nr:hypothetical protein Bbelb_275120 [Branchiostoma belcheri]